MSNALDELRSALREFAAARDWDQFHSPKNLCCALSVEAAELLEHFQWLPESSVEPLTKDRQEQIAEEIGDVLLYLIRLCDKLEIDPVAAANHKLRLNAVKYPVHLARGTSKKYTEL